MTAELTRTHYIILFVLALLPLIVALIALPFMPDTVPAHRSWGGIVDRWGSKYETLVLPAIALVTGLFMIWMTKFSAGKDDYAGRMVFCISVGTALLFIAITIWLVYDRLTFAA
ncbi:MAG: DUF1648 domain-containing protein [Methanomassiliicoccaceae archaeon]|nr:DUF1648 domain-containing protein [Methanomassiliicoccaceae archaeon]